MAIVKLYRSRANDTQVSIPNRVLIRCSNCPRSCARTYLRALAGQHWHSILVGNSLIIGSSLKGLYDRVSPRRGLNTCAAEVSSHEWWPLQREGKRIKALLTSLIFIPSLTRPRRYSSNLQKHGPILPNTSQTLETDDHGLEIDPQCSVQPFEKAPTCRCKRVCEIPLYLQHE